jgi:hypothetical protein
MLVPRMTTHFTVHTVLCRAHSQKLEPHLESFPDGTLMCRVKESSAIVTQDRSSISGCQHVVRIHISMCNTMAVHVLKCRSHFYCCSQCPPVHVLCCS